MSPPWMPFYVGDYIGGTMHLSTMEHGAYLLLIMHYWQKGSLPTEDRNLASIVKLPLDSWMEIKATIAAFFEAGWRHRRIDTELANAQQALSKRSAAGKAGASARYGKRTPVAQQPESRPDANLPSPKEGSSSEPLVLSLRDRVFKSLGSPEGFFEEGELNNLILAYPVTDFEARLPAFWRWGVREGKSATDIKAMFVHKLKNEMGSTGLVESRAVKPEVHISPQLATSRLAQRRTA